MSDRLTCESCLFWNERSDIKATINVAGIIARDAPDTSEMRAGECLGHPPQTLIVPIQTLKGPGLGPQPFERFTMATRPACSLHPDLPDTKLRREYMQKTLSYMGKSERYQDRAMEIAEQSEADRKRWIAEHRAQFSGEGLPAGMIIDLEQGGKA